MREIHIDETLYTSKPQEHNRLEVEMRVYDLLEKLEMPYKRLDHDPTATIEDCHEVEKILDIEICKNLLLRTRNKSEFYLLVMPGEKKFITKEVSKKLETSRLSFAEGEYMKEYLDTTPGSASILGLMNDTQHKVKLVIDRDILEEPYFGCHPCINTSSLKIKTKDIFEKFLPHVNHSPKIIDI